MSKFIFKNLNELWFKKTKSKWQVKKNRQLFKISKKIVGKEWVNHDLLTMGKPGVTLRDLDSGKGKFPASFEGYQIVEPNDLIFCLYDIDETPRTIGYSQLNGMITSSYTIVKCFENVDPKFIFYIYLLIDNAKGLKPYYTGLRNSIRPETFMNIEISVPNFDIQKKIAKKLDSEILNLDKVISLQKNKIDLMEKLKQTAIYESLLNE